jgi:hypothetical protein
LVFGGDNIYPRGGWNDFIGSFSSVHEAVEKLACTSGIDWWHIVNASTGIIHKNGSRT